MLFSIAETGFDFCMAPDPDMCSLLVFVDCRRTSFIFFTYDFCRKWSLSSVSWIFNRVCFFLCNQNFNCSSTCGNEFMVLCNFYFFFFRIRFHFIGIFKEESSQDVLDVQIFLFEILGGKKFIDCTYEKFYDVSWQLAWKWANDMTLNYVMRLKKMSSSIHWTRWFTLL